MLIPSAGQATQMHCRPHCFAQGRPLVQRRIRWYAEGAENILSANQWLSNANNRATGSHAPPKPHALIKQQHGSCIAYKCPPPTVSTTTLQLHLQLSVINTCTFSCEVCQKHCWQGCAAYCVRQSRPGLHEHSRRSEHKVLTELLHGSMCASEPCSVQQVGKLHASCQACQARTPVQQAACRSARPGLSAALSRLAVIKPAGTSLSHLTALLPQPLPAQAMYICIQRFT